jgi:chain length determinant protein EpsF
LTLQQILIVLRARFLTILLILLATLSLVVGASLWLPRQYTATASVVVDVRSPDPIAGVLLPSLIMPAYIRTQVDTIKSKPVALRVAGMLKADDDPQFRVQFRDAWEKAAREHGAPEVRIAEALQKKLDVKPSRESHVIDISFKAADPVLAAKTANAFAAAYLQTGSELRAQSARQYATLFSEQGKLLREGLERAQAKLTEYQRRNGIVATDERFDHETARLNELSSQLAAAQVQAAESRSRVGADGASQSLPEVTQNPLIVHLKGQLAAMEGKLGELGREFGSNHPRYQSQESEIASLQRRIEAETSRLISGLATVRSANSRKEAELRAAVDAQKGTILALKRQRDDAASLMRDVDAAQKAYEPVMQRLNQSSLESNSPQTNISVLAEATPPLEPTFPRLPLNTAIAVFLGTLLGVGMAFVSELLDRRIRSPADLSAMLGLNVVGVIPRTVVTRRELGTARKPDLLSTW